MSTTERMTRVCIGYDLTLSSTRPRNRWCWRPSARTASTRLAASSISAVSSVLATATLSESRTMTTRRSMVRTNITRIVSSAATASTMTNPPMTAPHQRSCSVDDIATAISASQPYAAAVESGDDDLGVVDRRVEPGQAGGVGRRLGQPVVDHLGLVADRPGQSQERHDQGDDHQDHDDGDRVPDDPAGRAGVGCRCRDHEVAPAFVVEGISWMVNSLTNATI